MADLVEDPVFDAGIYQIETTDPVIGGAPNVGTGAGMSNIPHQQLARRTRWLKDAVDAILGRTISAAGLATGGGNLSANRTITVQDASQLEAEEGTSTSRAMSPLRVAQAIAASLGVVGLRSGVSPGALTNFSAAPSNSAFHTWASADAGAPSALGAGGPLVRAVRTANGTGADIAFGAAGLAGNNTPRMAARVTSGQFGDWGPWLEAWLGQNVTQSFSANTGYQRLPSGLIMQWLYGVSEASNGDTGTLLTFPIAFPTACMMTVGSDVGGLGRSVGVTPNSLTNCRIWARSAVSGAHAIATLRVLAIGN